MPGRSSWLETAAASAADSDWADRNGACKRRHRTQWGGTDDSIPLIRLIGLCVYLRIVLQWQPTTYNWPRPLACAATARRNQNEGERNTLRRPRRVGERAEDRHRPRDRCSQRLVTLQTTSMIIKRGTTEPSARLPRGRYHVARWSACGLLAAPCKEQTGALAHRGAW